MNISPLGMGGENGTEVMLVLKFNVQFKRKYRLMQKRGYDRSLLLEVAGMLKSEKPLDERYKDHLRLGKYARSLEYHIRADCLLIYQKWGKRIELQRREPQRFVLRQVSLDSR